eukprot:jgi/Ulvmu1/7328/UM035_0117.1
MSAVGLGKAVLMDAFQPEAVLESPDTGHGTERGSLEGGAFEANTPASRSTIQSPAIGADWSKSADYLEKTMYLGIDGGPTSPSTMDSQLSKSCLRGRLMQASRREADARLEANMLTADIGELSALLQQANSSLMYEKWRNKLLEQAIAAKDAKIQELQAESKCKADDPQNSRALRHAVKRADHAEEQVVQLEQQLKLVRRQTARSPRRPAEEVAAAAHSAQPQRTPGTARPAQRLRSAKDPWTARLLGGGQQGPQIGGAPTDHESRASAAAARPPHAPPADVLLLQGALRQAYATSECLVRSRRLGSKYAQRSRNASADSTHGGTSSADESGQSFRRHAAHANRRALDTVDVRASLEAEQRHRWGRRSHHRRARPATANPLGLRHHDQAASSMETRNWGASVTPEDNQGPSSPSQHMRYLLSAFDSHIANTRMLSSPPLPRSVSPPVCPVNINFHGTTGNGATLSHGAPQDQGDGEVPVQYHAGQEHEVAHSEHFCHGTGAVGHLTSQDEMRTNQAHQMQQQAALDHAGACRHRPTGRRHRFGSPPRVSASDIVPPEKVRAEALRQARIEYFADVQRIKQKRLQDWGQMFGQPP